MSTRIALLTLAAVLLAGSVSYFKGLEPLGRITFFLYLEGAGLLGLALLGLIGQAASEPLRLQQLVRPSRESFVSILKHPAFYLGFGCLVAGDLLNLV